MVAIVHEPVQRRADGAGVIRLVVVLAVVLALIGAYVYGRSDGQDIERAATMARDNAALTAAATRIREAEERRRAAEHGHARRLDEIATDYQREKANAKMQNDRLLADLRDGRVRLRIAAERAAAGDRDTSGQASAAACRSDGAAGGELPGPTSADLLALADDADAIVRQLASCQAVIVEDRK